MRKLDEIIRYLDGEVTSDEKKSLETELNFNSETKKTLEIVKNINKTLKDKDHIELINNLNLAYDVYNKEEDQLNKNPELPGRSYFLSKKALLIAAATTVFIIISTIVYHYISEPSNDKIFAQYYTKYEADVITRSDNDESNELIVAIQLYENGKYKEAVVMLNKIVKINHNNTAAHFFIGVSLIETGEYLKAIESFKTVILQQNSAFNEHTRWYMALCYIKTNQTTSATEILKEIARSESYYSSKANSLLNKMN